LRRLLAVEKIEKHKHYPSTNVMKDPLAFISIPEKDSNQQPSIKLKIKFGGHTVSTKSFRSSFHKDEKCAEAGTDHSCGSSTNVDSASDVHIAQAFISPESNLFTENTKLLEVQPISVFKRTEDENFDVHGQELDIEDFAESFTIETSSGFSPMEVMSAIEEDEVDGRWMESLELKKQRALLRRKGKNEHLQPSALMTLTDEHLKEFEERANLRRLLAVEKIEKHKKNTVDRLLKKQEAKARTKLLRSNNEHRKTYSYTNSSSSITVCVPQGYEFPLKRQKACIPSVAEYCGVKGCRNLKKYSCSKSSIPLCGLQCYRQNLKELKCVL